MGKKSRLKKEIKQGIGPYPTAVAKTTRNSQRTSWESFWVWLVYLAVGSAFLTPFILSGDFYFPFVGPKGLFLMGACQVAFFAWVVLAISFKKYRPKLERVLVAFAVLIIALILSTVFGDDPSRSFWSKFERMTGLVMWLHLFALFSALIFTFKKKATWKRFFVVSVIIGCVIAVMALFEQAGVKAFDFSNRGGSTLGNTSFLGSYLLFNLFLSVYLFFTSVSKRLKLALAGGVILIFAAIYFSQARAASWVSIGGLLLTAALFFSFKMPQKKIRLISRVALIIGCLVVLSAVVMLFIPGNPVSDKFIAITTKSRQVNWQMAWKGFLEKPVFGWGMENYYLVFPKYFNPCLYTPECGSEVWFDRTHNIVLDTMVTTGAIGLLAYLGFLIVLVWSLAKHLRRDFWAFATFTALVVAYFLQNLSVFDMPVSLFMLVFIAGFVGFLNLSATGGSEQAVETLRRKRVWPFAIVAVVFLVCFVFFVIQPAKADHYALRAVAAKDMGSRLEYAQKALDASSAGKYQIRDFFGEQFLLDIQRNYNAIAKDPDAIKATEQTLDFLARILEQSVRESPIDYSATLRLAQVFNIYVVFDYSKLNLAVKYSEKLMELSPNNQQSYWTLSQTRLYQGQIEDGLALAEKAIALEPRWFQSWEIAIQVAGKAGQAEKVQDFSRQALDLALSAIERNPDFLNYYKSAVYFAQRLGLERQAKDIALRAVEHNPAEWQNEFQDVLASTSSPAK